MAVSDAELDDIQRDAEATARLVGAPGSPVRLRAEATVRLVAEVRRLRERCDHWIVAATEARVTADRARRFVAARSAAHREALDGAAIRRVPEHDAARARAELPILDALCHMLGAAGGDS